MDGTKGSKKQNGFYGRSDTYVPSVAPSNYLRITSRISSMSASEPKETPLATANVTSEAQGAYMFKAEALHACEAVHLIGRDTFDAINRHCISGRLNRTLV